MVRAIDGHGNLIVNRPSVECSLISFPASLMIAGWTPGNGSVAKAGFNGVTCAIGEIIKPPVSVCHHVSTMGHFCCPICWLYHCQASSLIGSPTEPKIFNDDKSYFSMSETGDC